ncbi:MAG: DNA repair protein RecN [Brevefilum fermentans]|jgi:DNA repair protein RecN (Recombination protein N)|uniref:DNA repair protein RecN n=1 Tax=Candidatus Brevifilum fermentans TaxID=1986204 RepID=A0A1Y6K3L8_9CHLR|nr:DNA repair protein RecN [Brevefilum fermentans]MDI9565359.1 DNA repair protein RecN [Chloroflexota bacterium]SMX53447.1 DNA repair protein RecN [Brevefilum fermentans]HOM67249.1 DNA repair protein RecN [Brevefilum fermentans]
MLTELQIENFAIIQKLHLDFLPGLVIFTGETGAGKSIIMDALEAVLGGRAETTAIRTGAERAQVEATFRLDSAVREPIHALLKAEDLLDDPDYIVMGREIRREGRNIARINGRTVTAALQRSVGEYLIDIHGQSEHLSLLHVRNHLHLLDGFADIGELLAQYQAVYRQLVEVRAELQHLRTLEQDAARRMDMLTYQIQEIDAAQLQTDEESNLRQDRTRLANAESLAKHAQQALIVLEEGSPEVGGVNDLLGEALDALRNLARIDTSTEPLYERLSSSVTALQDLALEVRNYAENIEFNPHLLDQVEERIDLINNLKRKYGETIDAILAYAQKARAELESITHAGERISELEERQLSLMTALSGYGQALSQRRSESAGELSRGIEVELQDLQMERARFQIEITQRPDENGLPLQDGQRVAFDANGIDRVEFLVETNPGEGFKPLVKIASGGETSRLMLALKNVLANADKIPTLVFDEIDQGIGGRVGMVVGEKLWNLSHQHQVMCITHLPQLAAYGEQHYRVIKALQDGRTHVEVQPLADPERLAELAQMLGPISEGTLQSAEEILKIVHHQKTGKVEDKSK